MPSRLKPPCSRPGCEHTKPCPVHTKQANKQRGKTSQRGYGTQHVNRFRKGVLDAHPLCVLCRCAPATVADHYPKSRKQLIAEGLDPNDPSYGRGLCEPCHNQSTAQRQPGGWNAG